MKSNAFIIFTRIPIAGKTKTRLQTKLTPDECADIHKCFLKDIYKEMIGLKEYNIDIIVSYNPEGDFNILKEIFNNDVNYIKQEGNNLNEKIYNSIKEVLSLGYDKCVLIGADIPEITKENIIDAFNILSDNDFVFGESFDGGYYLVGMNKYSDIILRADSGILKDILLFIEKNNFKYSVIEKKHDIDEYEDLLSLSERINNGDVFLENTGNFLKNIGLL
ncbi:TIGR04282 family arsenosugar biosynthesis glycosyltransferase [Brachyspira murdochii]|uniref:TIGR04282 family arsenosugar biosynthesis glycosyltransferase n=1 Tax=Brachyspira murdochii TaxID=84378 RepID=UPI0012F51382|nr:TIGR04282 family arsenosugar biosynthesis glycosyltransferase [Brachyspira murdochii]